MVECTPLSLLPGQFVSMNGKTVIITGANGGIGKETAKEIAKRGAKVIMACRNVNNAKVTRDEIVEATKNENVVVKELNLASQRSIREFVEDILRTEQRLDVLIHNAGTAENKIIKTEDNLELTMATNHFGPFLLTHLLIGTTPSSKFKRILQPVTSLESKKDENIKIIQSEENQNNEAKTIPTEANDWAAWTPMKLKRPVSKGLADLLKRSAPSRIIVVASELYRLSSVNLNNLNPARSWFPPYIYYASKYANIYFTNELARRLEGSGVTANCLHPGMVDSGIWRSVPIPLNWPLQLIIKLFFKTPLQGCQTSVYLACSEEVENITGKYFMDCKERSLNTNATDMSKAKKLWELSEELVNLKPSDPKI